MARRRRTRGAWFPTIGTEVGVPGIGSVNASGRAFALTLASNTISTAVTPLTFDVPFEGDFISPGVDSLADVLGSGYLLRRVVGKVFAARVSALDPTTESDDNPAVLFCAGLLVARANDASSGGGQDTPIGSATATELNDNYSPLEVDTIREPWIWRRTWILGRSGSAFSPSETLQQINNATNAAFPASTALYGSVADGPHMDSKIKRLVTGDNRLWLAVSATPFPFQSATDPVSALIINGYFDYRIYGSLRKAIKSSVF